MERSSATVVVFGATGMVGGQVLRHALADPGVGELVSIGRRETGLPDSHLSEILHRDFNDFSPLEGILATADIVHWCLAAYQSQVSPVDYEKITVGYLAALVALLEQVNPTVRICLHGAAGASPEQTASAVFARVKGRAENVLTGSALEDHLIFRPGLIVPTAPGKGRFWPKGLLEALFRLFPALGIKDSDLGAVMSDAGLHSEARGVWENRDIRAHLAAMPAAQRERSADGSAR